MFSRINQEVTFEETGACITNSTGFFCRIYRLTNPENTWGALWGNTVWRPRTRKVKPSKLASRSGNSSDVSSQPSGKGNPLQPGMTWGFSPLVTLVSEIIRGRRYAHRTWEAKTARSWVEGHVSGHQTVPCLTSSPPLSTPPQAIQTFSERTSSLRHKYVFRGTVPLKSPKKSWLQPPYSFCVEAHSIHGRVAVWCQWTGWPIQLEALLPVVAGTAVGRPPKNLGPGNSSSSHLRGPLTWNFPNPPKNALEDIPVYDSCAEKIVFLPIVSSFFSRCSWWFVPDCCGRQRRSASEWRATDGLSRCSSWMPAFDFACSFWSVLLFLSASSSGLQTCGGVSEPLRSIEGSSFPHRRKLGSTQMPKTSNLEDCKAAVAEKANARNKFL